MSLSERNRLAKETEELQSSLEVSVMLCSGVLQWSVFFVRCSLFSVTVLFPTGLSGERGRLEEFNHRLPEHLHTTATGAGEGQIQLLNTAHRPLLREHQFSPKCCNPPGVYPYAV